MVATTYGDTELEKPLSGSAFLWRIIKYISRQNDDYLLFLARYKLYNL
jgi:hypothetical protein